ncbi:hypothetical protein ALC53_01690 [Atta colombica]|uniref:Uncharacterized protein n=1 Tax=Atta colombica TaxID=520822 RepID=A0A195BSX3_9HYME|nr:hypothetical protein ALC53_01690 [Atta colombica]
MTDRSERQIRVFERERERERRARGVTHEAPLSRAARVGRFSGLTAETKIGKIHKPSVATLRSLAHPLHCPRTAPRTVQARLRSLRFAESRVRATSAALALKSPCDDRLGDLAGASFRHGFLAFKSLIGRDRARDPLKSQCRNVMSSRLLR